MAEPSNTGDTGEQSSRTSQIATLIAALLGWMFDGFEMGLFPLIGKPAIGDLLGEGASPDDAAAWFASIIAVFLIGAATGGVVFGWLGDKIGRVRAMSLSIFTYAVFTGLCGFATEAWQIAGLRFIASLGMGGEWSLGVALVNEIWPGKSRAFVAGLIGAAANVGFLLVAVLSMGLTGFIESVGGMLEAIGVSKESADSLLANKAWRFLMITGAVPALLIFFIRIFVPESKKWEAEKSRGATSHWQNQELLGVLVGCLAALAIIVVWSPMLKNKDGNFPIPVAVQVGVTLIGLIIAFLGYLFPVRGYLKRSVSAGMLRQGSEGFVLKRMILGAALASVALLGTWGSLQWAPRWASKLADDAAKKVQASTDSPVSGSETSAEAPKVAAAPHFAAEKTQMATAIGAIIGTIVAAMSAEYWGRRITYSVMCAASMGAALLFYGTNLEFNSMFIVTAFIAGGVTASFYGFFPLYFPELFPTAVRATGQGFSFNFGRIVAAVGGLQTSNLESYFGGDFAKAGSALSVIYLIGVAIVWLGPETKNAAVPD